MKILFSCLLALFCTTVFAQQVIKRDTFNIHGFIYNIAGKPVNFLYIESTQKETEHNTFKLGAFTNDRGYFELKGAKFNDTLTIGPDIHYDIPQVYNNGARYLFITLPPAKALSPAAPILITQKRKYPKVMPSFTVTSIENLGKVQTVTSPAQFPGGIDQLNDFIRKNIQYPESALKKNIEGTVLISFTITKEGSHRDYKILRGISDDCDDEVLRVIKKSPNWQPAIDHDQAVAVQETVSVEFKLTDN
jgi:TonB family protein